MLTGEQGVNNALRGVERLFDVIADYRRQIEGEHDRLNFEELRNDRVYYINSQGKCLYVSWYHRYSNSLDDSRLDIVIFDQAVSPMMPKHPPVHSHQAYVYGYSEKQEAGWCEENSGKWCGPTQLVDTWFERFLTHIDG